MITNTKSDSSVIEPATGDSAQLKRKLAWRMGVAAVMIATLLGGLALFDYVTTTSDESEASPPVFTEPVPVAKKNPAQALGTVTLPTTEMIGAPAAGEPESTSAPIDRAIAREEEPARARPADGRSRSSPAVSPAVPAPAHDEVRLRAAAATAEKLAPPLSPQPLAVDTSAGLAHTAAEPSAPTPVSTDKPLPGYTVQAGSTFFDPKQAEAIYTKLAQEGIPVMLETRVLVGPFRTRAEADSARARMRALGIDAPLARWSGKR